MGSGEEGPAEDDDEEPADPSIADLAGELDLDDVLEGRDDIQEDGDDAVDGDGTSPSFADLLADIRRQRAESPKAEGHLQGGSSSRHSDDPSEADAGTFEWDWRHADTGEPVTGPRVTTDDEAILELVGDATNVLLLGDLHSPADDGVCTTLLGAEQPANIVLVTLTQSSDERLSVSGQHLEGAPNRIAVVDVGDPIRSDDGSGRTTGSNGSIVIESVADPTDLMRIGITISRLLTEFEDGGGPTTLCFHSLTALLQFVDDERALFRFIHTLRGRVRAAGARAHYHLDSRAHDDKAVALLRPLFDVTLRVEEDGQVSEPQFP